MADHEIPDIADGGAAQAGDLVHVVRGPNSRKAVLGNAAGKDVGTGSGDVAAGDAGLPKAGGAMTGVLALDDSTNVSTAPPLSFDGDANTGVGHSAADTIEIVTGGVARHQIGSDGSQKSVIPGGSTLLPEFKCRAWANFDGTRNVTDTGGSSNGNPVLLKGSGNIASIVKDSTGNYTVTFTTAMPDANYSVVPSGLTTGTDGRLVCNSRSASSFTLVGTNAGNTVGQDQAYGAFQVFR